MLIDELGREYDSTSEMPELIEIGWDIDIGIDIAIVGLDKDAVALLGMVVGEDISPCGEGRRS